MRKLYLMITIVDRAFGEEYVSFFRAFCRSTILNVLAHGTAAKENLDMLGLESTEKTMLFCAVGEEVKRQLFRELKQVMHINAPGSGISIAVPLKSITALGIEHLSPEFDEWTSKNENSEENKMEELKYELIVVIANQDGTDEIMKRAREAGAGGGTYVRAKGTAPEEIKKFFGVNISEDKDMIFIAAKADKRRDIMKAVSSTNVDGKVNALSFSLPINTVAGLFDDGE